MALRVSLIFPAAAIGRPIGFQTAWEWIEGNFWRLFACSFAAYFPFAIVQMLISGLSRMFPSLLGIVFEALRLVVAFIGAAVIAALLSHLYRDIGAANETV
jgi:NADH:ubiquinone oxidoreductase subunit K